MENKMLEDNQNTVPYVKWSRDVSTFNEFIRGYREITGHKMGGTKDVSKYTDPTVKAVLSVQEGDNLASLPHRISLFNFKIGNPITSHGCICRCQNGEDPPEYLLIYREIGFEYIDFISGNYRDSSLYFLIDGLSERERKRLLENEFFTLWNDLYHRETEGEVYNYALSKFLSIRPYLPELFSLVPHNEKNYSLWSFPKGRVNYIDEVTESPIACALREFTEETGGFQLSMKYLIRPNPIIERYLGSNSKNYQTNYFIFNVKNKGDLVKTIPSSHESEAYQIKWMNLQECYSNLIEPRYRLLEMIEEELPSLNYCELNPFWSQPDESYDIFYS